MERQSIQINVTLDPTKMPEHIDWTASGNNADDNAQQAKAVLLSLWDGEEKTAMRIDLWTKRMMVDEMNDFFVQTLLTLGDTYTRATRNETLGEDLKKFARDFKQKADQIIKNENEQQGS